MREAPRASSKIGSHVAASSDFRAAGAIASPGDARSSHALLLADLLCIGLGLLIVAGSKIPAEYVPGRWVPELEKHRFDIAFFGLAIAVSLAAVAVVSLFVAR